MQEIQVAQTFDNLCFEPFCIVSCRILDRLCAAASSFCSVFCNCSCSAARQQNFSFPVQFFCCSSRWPAISSIVFPYFAFRLISSSRFPSRNTLLRKVGSERYAEISRLKSFSSPSISERSATDRKCIVVHCGLPVTRIARRPAPRRCSLHRSR